MYPTQLHSYLLWRSSVKPDAQTLASRRYTAAVSLLPATMVGIFVFGWWAGCLLLLSIGAAFFTDFVLHRFVYKDSSGTRDGTWLLTGLLLALLLPPNVPWAIPVIGASVAVFAGKHYFSVDGMPFLQPVVVGLLVLHLIGFAWPGGNRMAGIKDGQRRWPVLARSIEPATEIRRSPGAVKDLLREFFGGDVRESVTRAKYREKVFAGETNIKAQAVHGPRPIDLVKADPSVLAPGAATAPGGSPQTERYDWFDMVLGYVPATIGGSSVIALGFGILLLLFTGAASPTAPGFALLTMFSTLHFLAWCSSGSWVTSANVPIHLLTGSTILGLFYLAADPATSPRSFLGKVYAGVAVGLLEVFLRIFTPLPEGMIFSVFIVQSLSFPIDQWLAPPAEEGRAPGAALTQSSLGRL